MDALLRDPAQRRRLGEGAQLHAIENYSWDAVAAETAALYRDITGGRAGTTAGT
jgi:glycosyltransferase involved in cell wall biosynthesis